MMLLMTVARYALALFFISGGVLHFTASTFFVAIMPPYLPWHLELVYVSGICEILGGVGLLVPFARKVAGIGLIALTVAVFPANVHMALSPEQFDTFPLWLLYARLPLQLAIAWSIWWTCLVVNQQIRAA